MSSRKNNHPWLPHIYVILIGVSLGGALMFSLIFIGAYYYISLRNTFPTTSPPSHEQNKSKFFHPAEDIANTTPPFPPKAHSSPKGGEREMDKKSPSSNRSCVSSVHLKENKEATKTKESSKPVCDTEKVDAQQGLLKTSSQFFSKYRSRSTHKEQFSNKDTKRKSAEEKRSKSRSNTRTRTPSRRSKDEESSEVEIDFHDLP